MSTTTTNSHKELTMANANHKAAAGFPERSVKVQQSLRQAWPSHLNKPSQLCPWIKLSGRWIEHAGFLPGQQVRITVEHGKLIITAA
jgi:toxic protein SymE